MQRITLLAAIATLVSSSVAAAAEPPLDAKRIVFLGDSITHAGHFVAEIDVQLRLAGIDPVPEMINLGLPSETCSGLSEPDHPFPRPDVHERIDRALTKLKPDVVVACYGMNDGIYYPFSEERFAAYQRGVRGIVDKVKAANAKTDFDDSAGLRSASAEKERQTVAGRRGQVRMVFDLRRLRQRAAALRGVGEDAEQQR